MGEPDAALLARARGQYHASLRRRYPKACADCGAPFAGLAWQR